MKEKFRDKLGMSKSNIERLETINSILEEYRQQNFILTLRQLYDASGKDMVRDVEERLIEMGVKSLEVINPALTMEQVNEYEPPENPAKQTDPRAKWYIEKYGESSWELDALPPPVLMQIIRDNVIKHMDLDLFQEVRIKEANQKKVITRYAADYVESEEDFDDEIDLDDETDFEF